MSASEHSTTAAPAAQKSTDAASLIAAEPTKEEAALVTVTELLNAIGQLRNKQTDEAKITRVQQVLEHLDDDHDGVIDADLALEVRPAFVRSSQCLVVRFACLCAGRRADRTRRHKDRC